MRPPGRPRHGTCPVGCPGAPPLEVPRDGNGSGGRGSGGPARWPCGAPAGRHRAWAGRTRSAGAPDRRGQARPRAGQRPGHSPGAVRRPGVWSRGARSAFADMPRSVSAAPAGVNPRPWPPNAPLADLRVHPVHPLRPALSPALRPARHLTSAAEKRGRISWPRNAAATRSPRSAPDPGSRHPGCVRRSRAPRAGRPVRPGTHARRVVTPRAYDRRRCRADTPHGSSCRSDRTRGTAPPGRPALRRTAPGGPGSSGRIPEGRPGHPAAPAGEPA